MFPSLKVAFSQRTGNPATILAPKIQSIPFCTYGMNSCGTDPPLTVDTNSKYVEHSSYFHSFGSKVTSTRVYWPDLPYYLL